MTMPRYAQPMPQATAIVAPARASSDVGRLCGLFLAHVALALVLRGHSRLAGIHALATLAVGVWAALRWSPARVAAVVAYVLGAEVLWRMTSAPIPWEFAKYAVVLVAALATARFGREARWRVLPLLYFLLLTPSILLLAGDRSITTRMATQMLSFNLSGPLALCVSVWFFSQLHFGRPELRRFSVALLCPIVAVATLALVSTYQASDLAFTDESNLVTSGGFGPNQVSAIFGLGAMLATLLALDEKVRTASRLLALALAVALGTQSAMTFSRGGLYTAAGALLLSSTYLLQDRRTRRALLLGAPVVALTVAMVVLPRLDSITGGALLERFRDYSPSHRQEIVREDMRIWDEHPVLGVGPGMAKRLRNTQFRIAHTEYTRMLSEHGALGGLAIVCLLAIAFLNYRAQWYVRGRGLSLAFSMWSLLAMLHIGMRVAAVAVIFGVAAIRFTEDDEESSVRASAPRTR